MISQKVNVTINDLSDGNVLVDAFNKSKIDSDWKQSVQKFEANLLINILNIQRNLRNGTYKQKPFYEFVLNERGKTRYIKSLHIRDRVVQRALCDCVLTPLIQNKLIYDNGASVVKKGITFSRNRLQTHLEKFIRKYGTDGYILLIDFSKFFDNIPHDLFLKQLKPLIVDEQVYKLIVDLVNSFKIDVSYLTEEEYNDILNQPFNMLEHKETHLGEKYLYRSMGIGSQISQLAGIYYLTPIDNYCKIKKQCKYYGRYMDDIYIISNSKKFLQDLLFDIIDISKQLKIFINVNKTQIIKLSHGFTYLQIKYKITKTGKIIKTLSPKAITRQRRRIKKYKNMLLDNKLQYSLIENAYKSWRGNVIHYKCYNSLIKIDNLYIKLFSDYISEDLKQIINKYQHKNKIYNQRSGHMSRHIGPPQGKF